MRERVLTLACALGALLLFGTLFMRGGALSEKGALPTTEERSDNGLKGAWQWLQAEGVATMSLREHFGALAARKDVAASGNLLIVTLPAASNFRRDELVALDRWVREGNTLLVLAPLLDRPGWAQYPFMGANDLRLLSGLAVASATPKVSAPARGAAPARNDPDGQQLVRSLEWFSPLASAQRSRLLPSQALPFFAGVREAVGFSDYAPSAAGLSIPRDGFSLVLGHEAGSGADAMWMRPAGQGTIIVSGFASLFTNRALAVPGNARLLANLIGATVAPRGAVIFDDEHQGLSANYDPAKFFADRRLYATLAVIVLVWLIWVLGATRLRMPVAHAHVPREAELVRVAGLFLARVTRPAAAARRVFAQFFERLADAALTRGGPRGTEQLWQYLESHPKLARAQVMQLRAWHAAAAAGRRVPLLELHNLIVRTERQLAS